MLADEMTSFRTSQLASAKLMLGAIFLLYAVIVNAQFAPGIEMQQNAKRSPAVQLPVGSIIGTVLDPTGAVTVGAKVQLTSKDPSPSLEAVSGENGQFSFSYVPPGPFQLTITATGFANQTFSGELQSGQTYLLPAIVLQVATALTEVRVGVPTVGV